jgi:nitrite reductase/ring-hydroxylating ferredoxin subunit
MSDRRDILRWLARGLSALLLGGGAVMAGRVLQPPRTRDLSRRISVGLAGGLPPGATLYLPDQDVHVLHGAAGLYALSGRCTHLGCSLQLQPDGFSCPCHGARFDRQGKPVAGPAPRPLTGYRVLVDPAG